jgi:hypothetical protein
MADRLITSEEMRTKSSTWNLACDVALRKRLEATAQRLHQRAQSLTDNLDELNSKAIKTSAKLGQFSI